MRRSTVPMTDTEWSALIQTVGVTYNNATPALVLATQAWPWCPTRRRTVPARVRRTR